MDWGTLWQQAKENKSEIRFDEWLMTLTKGSTEISLNQNPCQYFFFYFCSTSLKFFFLGFDYNAE